MSLQLEVHGVEEVLEHLEEYDPEKRLGRAVDEVTKALLGFVVARTPVVTGSMQRAWRSKMRSPLVGRVFIDTSAVNSASGVRVISYAPSIDEKYGLLDAAAAEGESLAVAALGRAFDGF